MSPKAFLLTIVITVIVAAAAVAVTLERPQPVQMRVAEEPVFPVLREQPARVAAIEVIRGEDRVRLARTVEGQWVAPDRHDYPLELRKVRALLTALADMRLLEAKTSRPDRHHRLEVEEPDAPGARSRLLRLLDAEGQVLDEAIIGRTRWRFTGGIEHGTYLRRPGEDQAWLAGGRLDLGPDLRHWLRPELVQMGSDEVASVEVEPRDGPAYRLERADPEAEFALEPMPEGQRLVINSVNRVTWALDRTNWQDVAPLEEIAMPETVHRAQYRSFDGLLAVVRTAGLDDDDFWITFEISATPDAAPEVVERAEELQGELEGWAFRLNRTAAERFALPYDSLLQPEEPSS